MTRQQFIDKYSLTMAVQFVPFSQSRNKAEKHPSLNWIVTVSKDGREIWKGDYMAGCGHCPSYKGEGSHLGNARSLNRAEAIRADCESGRDSSGVKTWAKGAPILPAFADVLYALLSDSSAIEYARFEEWASDYGYDVDSRTAEKAYQECLKIGLALRAAIGEQGLNDMRIAFEDF